ncbi:ROK family protein [Candidatus Woesearchaeota archaeon]|nr:ROK family protein [Candidatus Woesearchaeota archaeon]
MAKILAIDIGGTKTEAMLAEVTRTSHSYKVKILDKNRTITRGLHRKEFLKELKNLMLETNVKKSQAISISIPGYEINNKVVSSPNVKAIEDFNLQQWVKTNFKKKVFIENDANCFAFAEAKLGSFKKSKNLLGVIIGTGVGLGIIINQELYKGFQGIAGEFGHTVIVPRGRLCSCGKKGCLEAYISGPSITRRYIEAGGSIPSPDPLKIWKAKKRDVVAGEVIDETIELMSVAFSNLANLLNPEFIIVGGGISNLPFFKEVNARMRKYTMKSLKTLVVKNTLGDDASILGAAILPVK